MLVTLQHLWMHSRYSGSTGCLKCVCIPSLDRLPVWGVTWVRRFPGCGGPASICACCCTKPSPPGLRWQAAQWRPRPQELQRALNHQKTDETPSVTVRHLSICSTVASDGWQARCNGSCWAFGWWESSQSPRPAREAPHSNKQLKEAGPWSIQRVWV